jgi:hypothetical protein
MRIKVGLLVLQRGKVMRDFVCKVFLGTVLCALVVWLGGCALFEQPGETMAEGHRRHLRNLRINQQEMMQDIDRVMLFEKPSRLTDKRIP